MGWPSAPLRRGPDGLEFWLQGTMLIVAPVSTKYLSLVNSSVRKTKPAFAGKCIALAAKAAVCAAKAAAELWGDDPVHPGDDSYAKIARFIESDLANPEARYTNPPANVANTARKRPCIDLSLQREDWVRGCQATLVRQDVQASHNTGGLRGGSACSGYRGRGRGFNNGAPRGGAFRGTSYHRGRGRF
jgi:hypothetical protein